MSELASRIALALGVVLLGGALAASFGLALHRGATAGPEEAPALASASATAPPDALASAGAALPDEGAGPADGGVSLADGRLADGGLVDGGEDAGAAPFEKLEWSATSRAATYGALSRDACDLELKRRGIPNAPARGAPLVDRPVRLTGPLHGVTFRGDGVAKAGSTSPFDIADCRLVLALDDLAAILEARGITTVVHVSMHRPAPKKAAVTQRKKNQRSTGKGKAGGRAQGKPATAERPSQHALGLAIDVAAFEKADGARLEVKADWHGALGAPPCGPGSEPTEATPQAIELRGIVCAVYASGLFNVILTPNANEQHADHFHFDIKRDGHYFLLE
ncbi:extensin family protein [Sorangium sp. So ce131]|uniref:extensin family protein n=1 Tax=Sorangium sp. So ce131 TaxID=3133282 RepID=UPI003F605EEB